MLAAFRCHTLTRCLLPGGAACVSQRGHPASSPHPLMEDTSLGVLPSGARRLPWLCAVTRALPMGPAPITGLQLMPALWEAGGQCKVSIPDCGEQENWKLGQSRHPEEAVWESACGVLN